MKKEIIKQLKTSFEEAAYEQDGVEYWLARDLQLLLGYFEWRNFTNAVEKAKEACKNSQIDVNYHFVDVNKTIPMPKNAEKNVDDIMLTRYACYLIA